MTLSAVITTADAANPEGKDVTTQADSEPEVDQTPDGRRVVRRRSRAAG